MPRMYSVFDKKTASYGNPYPAKTDGEANRMFAAAVNTPDIIISLHPADFALYAVGSFDDQSGEFTSQKPVHIAEGVDHA